MFLVFAVLEVLNPVVLCLTFSGRFVWCGHAPQSEAAADRTASAGSDDALVEQVADENAGERLQRGRAVNGPGEQGRTE